MHDKKADGWERELARQLLKVLEIGYRFPQDERCSKRVSCSVSEGLLEECLLDSALLEIQGPIDFDRVLCRRGWERMKTLKSGTVRIQY